MQTDKAPIMYKLTEESGDKRHLRHLARPHAYNQAKIDATWLRSFTPTIQHKPCIIPTTICYGTSANKRFSGLAVPVFGGVWLKLMTFNLHLIPFNKRVLYEKSS